MLVSEIAGRLKRPEFGLDRLTDYFRVAFCDPDLSNLLAVTCPNDPMDVPPHGRRGAL